jgi:hypothetical protein
VEAVVVLSVVVWEIGQLGYSFLQAERMEAAYRVRQFEKMIVVF